MGARPVFSLNSLRFGNITEVRSGTQASSLCGQQASCLPSPGLQAGSPQSAQAGMPVFRAGASDLSTLNTQLSTNRRLFAGVVSGIAHCGNCIGVPTIGGEG